MKPYVLNYSETISLKRKLQKEEIHRPQENSSTFESATMEPTDPDEISLDAACASGLRRHNSLYLSTVATESIESSDPDEIVLDSTLITRSIEPNDDESIDLN